MILTNKIGIIIIEALHRLKEPSTLKEIVDKVAALTNDLKPEGLEDAVLLCLQGGIRHGYIQKRRNKYAFRSFSIDYDECQKLTHRCSSKPKIKQISTTKIEKQVKETKTVKDDIKTLFKSKMPLRAAAVGDANTSSSSITTKKQSNPTIKHSVNSLPVNIKTNMATAIGKTAKKTSSLTNKRLISQTKL